MDVEPSTSPGRIASLDQFRGYTVAAMMFVNFAGGLNAFHSTFRHHNTYCSYADTIMPQFFFAVGFSYRLTFLRRLATLGRRAASLAVVRRALGLILLGFVLYHLDGRVKTWAELKDLGLGGFLTTAFRRELCQTLVQIALTSVWILPVVAASAPTRVLYLIGGAILHLTLSWWFYLDYAWKTPVIDGGWLGILSWAIPMLVGTLAYDAIAARDLAGRARASAVPSLLGWAAILMLAGYGLASMLVLAPPPFTPPATSMAKVVDLWTMSQRTGSVSYMTFAAGFSLAVYALFVAACDAFGASLGVFRTFGTNALAAYIAPTLVEGAVRAYLPRDAPLWYASAGTLLHLTICWALIRYLEKNRIFLKL
ncbi:heparan-alpha-glucosaminide N-acetyltransferase domain-containing protein [Paludisphaera mucosa]|uniref:Heparan-alpha-glucosaminide N-acetyltransferase domain-containing protein n=1 Tax=Paludisphaera mucosa TaxID=3030827 RepID=A0ABT6FDM8_9BACT|nr:heparan-alpha-glucosaminide N-acetyltransferase domain-containing protein [Paludisphaera mucosa]MDG3005642.1 heparan-alpha-glucosaminide N-acetyltransferase domain-containing protein [Paludisphaera mucosa]